MAIKIESTGKELSSLGGMLLGKAVVERAAIQQQVQSALPTLSSGQGRSWDKFQALLLGFVAGAECLDDMATFARDPGFLEISDGADYTPKAYGDFLRSFSGLQIRTLQEGLIKSAYSTRQTFAQTESMVFDFDSTVNEQHGRKMEGVRESKDGVWGLDTFQVFDELGLQYWNEVRPGATFSAEDVSMVIHEILARMPKTKAFKNTRVFGRADSAFCNINFFNACSAKQVHFVCTMRENMFQPHVDKILQWEPQRHKGDKRLRFYDGRECELGETCYRPENGAEVLRIVSIRAVKVGHEGVLLKNNTDYDHYSWVSNIGEHMMSGEKLIKFYRKRGHMENYIRELKYGFDLKHYPCLKLDANRVYGLIAAFAHNIIRFIALKDRPNSPQFSKAIRNRLLHLPAQIVRHARDVVFRFHEHFFKEVQHWLEVITNTKFVSCEETQTS